MTVLQFQDELIKELKKVLSGYVCKSPDGEMVPFRLFSQDIPMQTSENDEDPVPYVIVRIAKGKDDGTRDSFHDVKIVIIIGVWDDDKNNQGYRTVMDVITKIYTRFAQKSDMKGGIFTGDIEWALQQDGYFPYWFGAIEMYFHVAAVRREDEWI